VAPLSEPAQVADSAAAGPTIGPDGLARCPWASTPEYRDYHDEEWGRPLHGDVALFEKLALETFQSGLSWLTILRKRAAFRSAFAGFDIEAVAGFGDAEVARLMSDAGIVRNRAKIGATIDNAQAVARLRQSEGDGALDRLLWSFAPPPRPTAPRSLADLPARTAESTAMSQRLKAAGFRWVGPTTLYALMQATGMVDDHLAGCHRRTGAPLGDSTRPHRG
jgi:DNA-3-methyladenine glycosylase I